LKINADLHSHSTASDGLLAPAALARLASENGVTLFALTDHDQVGGLGEAAQASRELGLAFVPGVEISVTWESHTLHIVGLGVDDSAACLQDGLARVRGSRTRRAARIAEELSKVGIEGALEGATALAEKPDVISRTHFARFLVERNHARDVKSVFHRFLAKGKPGFVAHEWASLGEAVTWICDSGGVAVIAHPGRYGLANPELDRLIGEFMSAGGRGIEVITGSHTRDQYARFARVAKRFGLAASRGSDYHGPGESRVAPGALPELPQDLTPVWQLL
jgi:predicted metal-dependent phosphoesterase TrpH